MPSSISSNIKQYIKLCGFDPASAVGDVDIIKHQNSDIMISLQVIFEAKKVCRAHKNMRQ